MKNMRELVRKGYNEGRYEEKYSRKNTNMDELEKFLCNEIIKRIQMEAKINILKKVGIEIFTDSGKLVEEKDDNINYHNLDLFVSRFNFDKALFSYHVSNELNMETKNKFEFISITNKLSSNTIECVSNLFKGTENYEENLFSILKQEQNSLDKKLRFVDKYFSEKDIKIKVLKTENELFERMPAAYRLLSDDPSKFKDFYASKFKKESDDIKELSNQELYGVLKVFARKMITDDLSEQEAEEFSKQPPGNLAIYKGRAKNGTRSPHFGKWYGD